jgi:hypothetical protein
MHIERTQRAYARRTKRKLAATLSKNATHSMGTQDANAMLSVAQELERGDLSAAEIGFTESSLRHMANWVLNPQGRTPLLT